MVLTFGLIACAGVLPLALIADPISSFYWRLIDCSLGCGAMVLWPTWRIRGHAGPNQQAQQRLAKENLGCRKHLTALCNLGFFRVRGFVLGGQCLGFGVLCTMYSSISTTSESAAVGTTHERSGDSGERRADQQAQIRTAEAHPGSTLVRA